MGLYSGRKGKSFFVKLQKIKNKNVYHIIVTKTKGRFTVVEVLGLKYVSNSANFCFIRLDRLSFWANLNTRFSYKVKKLVYNIYNYSNNSNVIIK